MYKLLIEKNAEKEIKNLPNDLISNIIKKIKSLSLDPTPIGCKKLNNDNNYYRIRIGNFRVVYGIDFDNKIIKI